MFSKQKLKFNLKKQKRIMKAKYLKPIIEVEPLMDDLMITASIAGINLEDGGDTGGSITEGEAREFEFTEWDEY